MANKRSRRNKVSRFYCPHCGDQLWRLGTGKHYLYYQGKQEVQEHFRLTHKKASLLAGQKYVQLDRQNWLEEFFCEQDGKLWLNIWKQADGSYQTSLAHRDHWQRSSRTIDPTKPNPSVSEFSYRMSRKSARV